MCCYYKKLVVYLFQFNMYILNYTIHEKKNLYRYMYNYTISITSANKFCD
jgi:hypothetical protein